MTLGNKGFFLGNPYFIRVFQDSVFIRPHKLLDSNVSICYDLFVPDL